MRTLMVVELADPVRGATHVGVTSIHGGGLLLRGVYGSVDAGGEFVIDAALQPYDSGRLPDEVADRIAAAAQAGLDGISLSDRAEVGSRAIEQPTREVDAER